ncbi:MAG: MATE family efflux transporter [Treponema sp.]|nr:MATE family efflux transporter [Treponema sp.]
MEMSSNFDLSRLLAGQATLDTRQKLKFVCKLSVPGILAQISSIVMQYIDAAMVGKLGADASASIGLVASSTWVLGSLCNSISTGFTVQVAQAVGAGKQLLAKTVLQKSIKFCLIFSFSLAAIAMSVSGFLPAWLGSDGSIRRDASLYFLIYSASVPFYQLIYLMGGMLQCSGNMRTPSILNSLMCVMDVGFNALFIGGLGMGVLGAALGSAVSVVIVALLMLWSAVHKSEYLGLTKGRSPKKDSLDLEERNSINRRAVKLASPIAVQSVAFTGALVVVTKLIAPLGSVSLSANSFAVTAEALCYMPGYGISDAATTLVGQSVGAKRKDLADSFSWITVISGMAIMLLTGILMYAICPVVFRLLTPVPEIRELSIKILRIELFAEPLYGASIVATGALRGKNDTLVPSILNLISLWIVRLGLSFLLVKNLSLVGIWIAMAIELCFRGLVMLVRLLVKTKKSTKNGIDKINPNRDIY